MCRIKHGMYPNGDGIDRINIASDDGTSDAGCSRVQSPTTITAERQYYTCTYVLRTVRRIFTVFISDHTRTLFDLVVL